MGIVLSALRLPPFGNLDIKNPNVVDPGHADPDKLLAEYRQLVAAVNDTREKLKRELQEALER